MLAGYTIEQRLQVKDLNCAFFHSPFFILFFVWLPAGDLDWRGGKRPFQNIEDLLLNFILQLTRTPLLNISSWKETLFNLTLLVFKQPCSACDTTVEGDKIDHLYLNDGLENRLCIVRWLFVTCAVYRPYCVEKSLTHNFLMLASETDLGNSWKAHRARIESSYDSKVLSRWRAVRFSRDK